MLENQNKLLLEKEANLTIISIILEVPKARLSFSRGGLDFKQGSCSGSIFHFGTSPAKGASS